MITTRRDPDRMSITEGVALANSVALGIVVWLNGLSPWPTVRGASVVIVYALAMSVAFVATARARAQAVLALGILGTIAGSSIAVPYVVRTGLSATGAGGLFTVVSSLAVATISVIQLAPANSVPALFAKRPVVGGRDRVERFGELTGGGADAVGDRLQQGDVEVVAAGRVLADH